MTSRTVSVPAQRISRWIDGFRKRHAGAPRIDAGDLVIDGDDGASARLRPLFPSTDVVTVDGFVERVSHPPRCGVVLVRRGGFAAAVVDDGRVEASDTGRRHVQGRTAAGGWSQQRFARRRQKQADELVDAAAAYAQDVVLPCLPLAYLVTGGDRALVEQVLADPRLRALAEVPRGPHLAVPDPRRNVVAELPQMLTAVRIDLVDP
ncbi:MAG: acVLRF1 family peptidyl-tRNA hydrolase [Actinomycetota bacterium]